jgi:hypothetical protein
MTRTREKLLEARYFLEQMRQTPLGEHLILRFHLSAFLSAAYSIPDVAKREFANQPGFKEWHRQHWPALEQERIVRSLRGLRGSAIHEHLVRIYGSNADDIVAVAHGNGNLTVTVTRPDGTVEQLHGPNPKVRINWRWSLKNFPDRDVHDVCGEYLSRLEAFVTDCESRFASWQQA